MTTTDVDGAIASAAAAAAAKPKKRKKNKHKSTVRRRIYDGMTFDIKSSDRFSFDFQSINQLQIELRDDFADGKAFIPPYDIIIRWNV
jgi:hypothetical protein